MNKLTKLEKRWILYDVGNSAFVLLTSTIIPIYYKNIAAASGISDADSTAFFGYATSLVTILVAVLGPVRSHTQVEISMTDARTLGLKPPVRQSGDTKGCPAVCLLAGDRMVLAEESVMVAQNHIHMTPEDARRYGVTDGQIVKVQMQTGRPLTFDQVVIRVREDYALAMHIDSDESNACAFQKGETGRLVR